MRRGDCSGSRSPGDSLFGRLVVPRLRKGHQIHLSADDFDVDFDCCDDFGSFYDYFLRDGTLDTGLTPRTKKSIKAKKKEKIPRRKNFLQPLCHFQLKIN